MIKLKTINKEKVKPIPEEKTDTRKALGYRLYDEPYANIFLLGRKKSGKTTVIYNMLKTCIDKDTKAYIFCSTVYKDSGWQAILKYLDKKDIEYEIFQTIEDKDNYLELIVKELEEKAEEEYNAKKKAEEEEDEGVKVDFIQYDDDYYDEPNEKETKKKRKKKYVSPEILFIFDDQSTALRSPTVSTLLKKNRHFKSKVIISSQYIHDLQPSALGQLDYMLIFKNVMPKKLELVHIALDLHIPMQTFMKVYNHAVSEKHCFLYIDKNKGLYRNCFNKEYRIT